MRTIQINKIKKRVAFTATRLILLVYLPYFNSVANTMPLNILEWVYVVCMAIICVIPFDLFKKKIK